MHSGTQQGLSLTCGTTVCPGLSVSDSEDDKAPAETLNKSIVGSPVNFSCCFGLVLVFEIQGLTVLGGFHFQVLTSQV